MSRRAKRPARNSKLNRGAEKSLTMASEAMAVLRDYLGPATARARELSTRYLAPIATVISPLGFVLLGTAVLLWILGASFGWQEALLGAFMATVLLLASVGFVLGRNDFSVDLDLHRTRVAVGGPRRGSHAGSQQGFAQLGTGDDGTSGGPRRRPVPDPASGTAANA